MKNLITALLLLVVLPASAHKFFVSIAEMEYDAEKNRIKVSLKTTAHDFEHILEDKFNKRIHIENYADTTDIMVYAVQYISNHFKIFSAEKQCDFEYIGKEVSLRDELFFYFSYINVSDPTTIKIINTLLFSLSDQQQNIVHYKYKDRTKSVTLIPAHTEAQITFD